MAHTAALDFSPEDCLEVAGVSVPLDPNVITPAIHEAMLDGAFEAEESAQIPRIVRPGDRVLEIGAGIGFISTLLSREERVEAVIAVEANPLLMGYMARLHEKNGVSKVRRLNAVLGNGLETSATFYLRQDFWMGSLMPRPNPYYATVEVPTLGLDRLLAEERVSLVVCDVEGAETFLFHGADLSGVDRIFVELHDHVTGLSGVGRIFSTLAQMGFIYDPRHSTGSVVLFQKVGSEDIVRPYGA
ncbi:FkbM family methyltransferase [Rhodobacteraceae bacterium DSL-40]|uniref:FkbM family methyltransferase n=1 Tax=Amaricoccus sp. B4 TaxID=3368557 RepID=UPI000DAD8014